jgi:hypothetical protein
MRERFGHFSQLSVLLNVESKFHLFPEMRLAVRKKLLSIMRKLVHKFHLFSSGRLKNVKSLNALFRYFLFNALKFQQVLALLLHEGFAMHYFGICSSLMPSHPLTMFVLHLVDLDCNISNQCHFIMLTAA